MVEVTDTTGSTRLRALREERGWTQQEVAEQLSRLAFLRMKRHVGVNADMVAKWERGVKAPSKQYRELLGLLFGVSAGGSWPQRAQRHRHQRRSLLRKRPCSQPSAMPPRCSISSGRPDRCCNRGCSTSGEMRLCAVACCSN